MKHSYAWLLCTLMLSGAAYGQDVQGHLVKQTTVKDSFGEETESEVIPEARPMWSGPQKFVQRQFEKIALRIALRNPATKPEDLMALLSHDPQIAKLYKMDAGVREKFTIEQHTQKVLEILDEQKKFYAPTNTDHLGSRVPGQIPAIWRWDVDAQSLMRITMSLHDIGKPKAVLAGDKDRQHEFTRPIQHQQLRYYGFDKKQKNISEALVDNDVLGDLLKGNIGEKEAAKEMRSLAQQAGISLRDYYQLQLLFFVADAASYPYLMKHVFTKQTDGKIVVRPDHYYHEAYEQLEKEMMSAPAPAKARLPDKKI